MKDILSRIPPRYGRAAVLPALLIIFSLAIVAFSILMLGGFFKFGKPELGEISFGTAMNRDRRPAKASYVFLSNTQRVYACLKVRAFEDTKISASWRFGGRTISSLSKKFKELTKRGTGKFIPIRADVYFYIERPARGWATGEYSVMVSLDGRMSRRASFRIRPVAPQGVVFSTYRDRKEGFSIDFPKGWLKFELSGNGGIGFTEKGTGIFPPRLVVYGTDMGDVDIERLNSSLGKSARGKFVSYSTGHTRGAYRMFEWDKETPSGRLRVRSVQAYLEGKDKVFGINCHCLSDEYEKNARIFEWALESFQA